eukprot:6208912-Amphidinium_carterae.2
MEQRIVDVNRRELHSALDKFALQQQRGSTASYILSTIHIPASLLALEDERQSAHVSNVGTDTVLTQFFEEGVITRRIPWELPFKIECSVDSTVRDELNSWNNWAAHLEVAGLSLKVIENNQQYTAKYEVRDNRKKRFTASGRLDALVLPGGVANDATLTVKEMLMQTKVFVEKVSNDKGAAAETQCLMCLALLAHQYDLEELVGLVVSANFQDATLLRYTKSSVGGSYEIDGNFALQHLPMVIAQLDSSTNSVGASEPPSKRIRNH